jgi:P27 family predicted phage terminase small subunit
MSAKIGVEEHKLRGTYRADRHESASADDAKHFTGGRLKMPANYPAEKATIWKQIFGPLHRRKTLTKADSAAAVILVEMWHRWEKVAALAAANPCIEVSWLDSKGTEHFKTVEHPAWKMATQLEGRIVAALKEFSATPASREKTRALKPTEKKREKEVDTTCSREAHAAQAAAAQSADDAETQALLDSIDVDALKI